jgi:enoyl-CoA hydratase/carnithine racemase
MGSSDLVKYSREGRVARITLNRPEKLNAFNDDLVRALKEALYRFDDDEQAFVAILDGEGRAFSSGADVRERQLRSREELRRLGGPEGRGAGGHGNLYESVNWKPIIASVHGYALGMAVGLVFECDISVVAEDTKMQITETRRGLWSSMYWARLQFRGAGIFADEVAITGRYFSGKEAAERGAITASAPPGKHLDVAFEYAEEILKNPPLAVRAVVRARRWYMQQHELQNNVLRAGFPLHLSDDFHESARAFAENRAPSEFQGR